MDRQWRDRGLYPLLGILLLLSLLYLNSDKDSVSFSGLLWQPKMGFVSTNSTHFTILDDGGGQSKFFYINGWNSYWLMQESVWSSSRPKVSEMLKKGAQMGMSVCRTWAFSDGSGPNGLQLSPGVFNERVFRGLDYVIVQARKNGVRLILSLVNNLNAFGGKTQYVRWAQEAGINISSADDSFFSHPVIRGYYKDYVKAVVTRKNSLSGVRYFEEPAIFAWELMNEPRCASSSSAPVLQAWIAEMASFIKSLDRRHLVTVGLEGFYGLNSTTKLEANPGEWAASLGSDFIQNSAIENIDFASVHAYPDSWIPHADLEAKANYLSRWIDSHISDGETLLHKPVLFTEVGSTWHVSKKGVFDRDVLLKIVYDKIYDSAKKGQAGAGALVWQLLAEGVEDYIDQFSLVPSDYPSTYKLIKEQSCRLERFFKEENQSKIDHEDPCLG
ncbi:Mannan endo-1,4-beta-mannosidase 6 [Turnera subulata]|uniref:mannan endo-1,4-beta-mannosidase n=1 Tax=Turnera subulata TaxID=218843 RepID=A0A9Q0F8G1_9ROSI|nr:Mannan endo-1,4-beta-mannosidase 6 [Turnera subulata]